MTATKIDIPGEDAWIVARLGAMVSHRIVNGTDDVETRQSLLRLLFGIQRLPNLFPDLRISLGNGHVFVEFNTEFFELSSYTDDGHSAFRLQYFSNGNHCIYWFDILTGDEKRQRTEMLLDELETALKEDECLMIEDHSYAGQIDEPPLDDYMEYSLSYEPL